MASEIQFDAGPGLTGITAYAMLRNATGQVYNTAGAAFENYNAANITDYDIALTEQGAIGYFVGDAPAIADGLYPVTIKQRAGGSPAVSDTRIGGGDIRIGPQSVSVSSLANNVITAASTASDFVTEIQSGLATAAALDAVDNFLDTEIASIISTLGTPAGASLAADLVVIDDFVDALESRLTAARAGYLDNINNSALASVPAFPSNFASLGINASGHVSRVTLVDTTTTNTDMISAAGIRTAVGLASANLDTQLTAIDDYLDTELAAVLAAVDTEVAAIVAAIGTPSNLGGGATLAANLSDIEGQTDDIGTAGAGLTAIPWNASWDAEVQSEVTDALNAALTESYRADQATGSVAQMLYELIAHHGEVAISGTTKTIKRIDGSTTAMSFTLNSGTTPTAVTRAA